MGFEQFSQVLRSARERAGLTKAELAARLGTVSRQSITNWEGVRPPKRGITPDEVNAIAGALDVSVLDLVSALGYDVQFDGIESDEEAALLVAYRRLSPVERRMLRAAAGLSSAPPATAGLESLQRLAQTDRRGGAGT